MRTGKSRSRLGDTGDRRVEARSRCGGSLCTVRSMDVLSEIGDFLAKMVNVIFDISLHLNLCR